MFPGEGPTFLDNRMTTVKRVFRRILPALIPVDPTESLTARAAVPGAAGDPPGLGEQPALAGLPPGPGPRARRHRPAPRSTWRRRSSGGEDSEANVSPDILHDELRILLGFWLEMPLHDYLDDRGGDRSRPWPAAVRRRGPRSRLGRPTPPRPPFNLRALIDDALPGPAIPREELTALLERLKTFAKRVHRSPRSTVTRRDVMPRGPAGSRIRCRSRSPRSSTTSPGRWP